MEEEITFLTLSEIMEIHQDQIDRYGGSLGVRDQGLLEAALSQPQAGFGGTYLHPDLHSMAGAYLFHLVKNHPFVDGNKRVATVTALVFLLMNDHELEVKDDLLEKTVFEAAASKISKDEIIDFFRRNTKAIV